MGSLGTYTPRPRSTRWGLGHRNSGQDSAGLLGLDRRASSLLTQSATTATASMMGVNTDRMWIGLHGPHKRMPWIRNEDALITSINATQIHPSVR